MNSFYPLADGLGTISYKGSIIEPPPIMHQPSVFVALEDYPQAIGSVDNSVVVPFIFISNNHDHTHAYMHTFDPSNVTLGKWVQELFTGEMKCQLSGPG